MFKKLHFQLLFFLLLIGLFSMVVNVGRVKAIGPIYIRADGTVDPPSAPIFTADNVTYVLTDNITVIDADGIIIERNNVVFDGAGYSIQGAGTWVGIGTYSLSVNVTIQNTQITGFYDGIRCGGRNSTVLRNRITAAQYGILDFKGSNISSYNIISGNIIADSFDGILIYRSCDNMISENLLENNQDGGIVLAPLSSNNTVTRNNLTRNNYGIGFLGSSRNNMYHNNFLHNTHQIYVGAAAANFLDDGYPSGGNYWSDYNGTDVFSGVYQNETGKDRIGDAPYVVDAYNVDRFPLIFPDLTVNDVSPCKTVVGRGYAMQINATVQNLQDFNETFNVVFSANMTIINETQMTLTNITSTTVTLLWNTSSFVYGNYTLEAIVDVVAEEVDYLNNNCTSIISVHVGVPGDVSSSTQGVYDMKCDMKDIAYLVILFNTKPTSPNWNPNADVDNNGVVSMIDIAIAILNFNKHE